MTAPTIKVDLVADSPRHFLATFEGGVMTQTLVLAEISPNEASGLMETLTLQ